jgi:putative Ca2+/H+ antiporter (TMEM165/GDT1 family)
VVIGTTLGMMLANRPAVIIGDKLAGRLPVKAIRVATAVVSAALGVFTLREDLNKGAGVRSRPLKL